DSLFFDGQCQRLGAGTDGGEWIVDLVHDARGERADRGELFRLSKALLRLAPLGHVFTDRNHVRHVGVVQVHWNLRDAVGPYFAGRAGFDLELLHSSSREDVLELTAQHLSGLAMQDLEDRAADRLLARDTLHTRLAFAIPRLNTVVAIDDVQTNGKRIDDLRREAALLLDLHRALDDFALEASRVLCGTERCGKHVGDDIEEHSLVRGEGLAAPEHE